MNKKQKEYLIGLINHDLSHFKDLDLGISKEQVEELLTEIKSIYIEVKP